MLTIGDFNSFGGFLGHLVYPRGQPVLLIGKHYNGLRACRISAVKHAKCFDIPPDF